MSIDAAPFIPLCEGKGCGTICLPSATRLNGKWLCDACTLAARKYVLDAVYGEPAEADLDARIERLRADLHAALDERARRNKAAAEAKREQRRLADAAFLGSDYG